VTQALLPVSPVSSQKCRNSRAERCSALRLAEVPSAAWWVEQCSAEMHSQEWLCHQWHRHSCLCHPSHRKNVETRGGALRAPDGGEEKGTECDPLTRLAPAGESAGCDPPSPPRGRGPGVSAFHCLIPTSCPVILSALQRRTPAVRSAHLLPGDCQGPSLKSVQDDRVLTWGLKRKQGFTMRGYPSS
jgi:hypothetical protein